MKAVAYQVAGKLDRAESLVDVTLEKPVVTGRDLLVRVEAVSVNPVDYKIRSGVTPEAGQWKVLGWDAVGTVVETGADVRNFKSGDEVWYAGSLIRPGANSEFHLVDERIVARKPVSLAKVKPQPYRSHRSPPGKCCLTDWMCVSQCRVLQTLSLLLVAQAALVRSLSSWCAL